MRELAATGVFGSRFRAIAKRTFERKTSNVPLRLRRFRKSVAWPDARMRAPLFARQSPCAAQQHRSDSRGCCSCARSVSSRTFRRFDAGLCADESYPAVFVGSHIVSPRPNGEACPSHSAAAESIPTG